MRTGKICLLYFTASVLLLACYTPRYVYSPSATNVPAFTKKGESKLSAALSSNISGNNTGNNSSTGYDLQAAYAISNHLAVQVDFYHRKEKNGGQFRSDDSSDIRYLRYMTGAGIGYYFVLDKNRQAVFQVFAGVAFGKFTFTDNGRHSNLYYNNFHEAQVMKIYVQPAFILHSKGSFIASLSSRFSLVSFNHIKTDYSAFDLNNYKLDQLGSSSYLFWEPAMLYTFGNRHVPGVQLEFQFGLSLLQTRNFIDYRAFTSSAALVMDIPKILRHKKTVARSERQ